MLLKVHGQIVLFKNYVTYSLRGKTHKTWAKLYKSKHYKTIKVRTNISLPAIEWDGAFMIYFEITKHLKQCSTSLCLIGIRDSSSWQNKSSSVCQTTQRTWRLLHEEPGATSKYQNPRLVKPKTAKRELSLKYCHSIYTVTKSTWEVLITNIPSKHSHYSVF